jgi:Na+-translocating ferredoxin:NAD+ oxidoreductase RnfD subunit
MGYGAMAGVLAMLLRYLGSYEESVCFALLLANAAMPLLIRAKNELAHLRTAAAQKQRKEA